MKYLIPNIMFFYLPNFSVKLHLQISRPSAELACPGMKNLFAVGWRMDRSFSTTRTLARYVL